MSHLGLPKHSLLVKVIKQNEYKMKKNSLLGLLFLVPILLSAQMGKVYDNLTLSSKILDGERKYAIYLPPDYEHSERSYPVLYLLHGAGDDQTGWVTN